MKLFSKSKKTTKIKKLQKQNGFSRKKLIIFAAAFALIGSYFVFRSFANTPYLLKSDGEFIALAPARIMNTPIEAGATYNLNVLGKGGVPTSNVSAVIINITAANATAPSYLTVYPSGTAQPTASSLNFDATTSAVANEIIANVGANGMISVYNANGKVTVYGDVVGYISKADGTAGSRMVPLTPARIVTDKVIAGGSTLSMQATGVAGVPTTGVSAVIVNVTASLQTMPSYLTVYPSGTAQPTASSLNFNKSVLASSNQIIAKVGADGKINIFNAFGNVNVNVDISGYFASQTAGYDLTQAGRMVSLRPSRLENTVLSAGSTMNVATSGRGGVALTNVSAVVVNLTAAKPSATSILSPGFLTAYPSDAARPVASSINFSQNTNAVANEVIVRVGADGAFNIYNPYGSTRVIVDVVGYFIDKEINNIPSVYAKSSAVNYTALNKISYDLTIANLTSKKSTRFVTGVSEYNRAVEAYIAQLWLSSSQGSIDIQCNNSQSCVKLYPAGSVTQGSQTSQIAIPFNFSVGKYKVVYEVISSGGQRVMMSLINQSGVKMPIYSSLISSKLSSFDTNYSLTPNSYSCSSPELVKVTVSNLLHDSVPANVPNASTQANKGACPGFSKVTYEGSIYTLATGIAAASRDTTPPTASATWDAARHVVLLSGSDSNKISGFTWNDQLHGVRVQAYGSTLSREIPVSTTSGYALGNNTLTFTVADTSGNETVKSITVNVTK